MDIMETVSKITTLNAQYTLCFLLMGVDGKVCDSERQVFVEIISKHTGNSKSYANAMFNALLRCQPVLNYKHAIENLVDTPITDRDATVSLLRKLALADGQTHMKELSFITKVNSDLKIN